MGAAPIRWHRDLIMGSMRRRWDEIAHWLPFGFQGGVEGGRPLLGGVLPVEQRLVHPDRLDRADPLGIVTSS